jgi:hypothetical protein
MVFVRGFRNGAWRWVERVGHAMMLDAGWQAAADRMATRLDS